MPRRVFHAIITALCLSGFSAHAIDSVRVRGSETFLPLVQRVSEDYMAKHPEVAIVVSGGGSTRGYKALLDGTADVAMVSGPMPESLQREFDRRGMRVLARTIGHRPLAAVVHPSNPLQDISLIELGAIFSGQIANWKHFGAKAPLPIRVLVGLPTGGLTESWKDLVLAADATFTARATVMPLERRMAAVASTPAAITYLSLNERRKGLKYLSINGVAPTPADVLSGAYPLFSPLTLVTTDAPAPVARAFIQHFFSAKPGWDLDGLIVEQR